MLFWLRLVWYGSAKSTVCVVVANTMCFVRPLRQIYTDNIWFIPTNNNFVYSLEILNILFLFLIYRTWNNYIFYYYIVRVYAVFVAAPTNIGTLIIWDNWGYDCARTLYLKTATIFFKLFIRICTWCEQLRELCRIRWNTFESISGVSV